MIDLEGRCRRVASALRNIAELQSLLAILENPSSPLSSTHPSRSEGSHQQTLLHLRQQITPSFLLHITTQVEQDQVTMDMVVKARAQAPCWHDEKPSPKPSPCDDEGDDILLDTYFDHSQPLDNSAFEALLETNFDDDESPSSKPTAANWRPADPQATSQPQQLLPTKMEPVDHHNGAAPVEPLSSSQTYHASRQHMYELPVNTAPAYHGLPMVMHPPGPYDQQMMAHHTHQLSLLGIPTTFGNGHHFATPSPAALPTMNDFYREPSYQSPNNNSGHDHNNNDLMDCANAIPEEDESGDNVDLCYAQLLYRCLQEAPDHTMSLKNVYEWVRQHSQKARDSSGTGWQNSVRHNLSMNAVSC